MKRVAEVGKEKEETETRGMQEKGLRWRTGKADQQVKGWRRRRRRRDTSQGKRQRKLWEE